jgi:hypothetical protein
METFYIPYADEYGFNCEMAVHSVEDAESLLESFKNALEDASVSRSYILRGMIESLEDQLANYKESPD